MGQICQQDEKKVDLTIDAEKNRKFIEVEQNFVKQPKLLPLIQQIQKQLRKFQFKKSKNKSRGVIKAPYRLRNGAIYWGEWQNGVIHGKGDYYLPDGSYIQGISTQGELRGRCRIIHPNGDYYEGQIVNNSANGEGIYFERKKKIKYEGNFKDNVPHGCCKETRQNGKKVKGNLKYKLGAQSWQYQGEFDENVFHGFGKLTNNVGIFQGQFKKGLKSGEGQFTWNNGKFFIGQYSQDMKNGFGTLYNANGHLCNSGRWINDQIFKIK